MGKKIDTYTPIPEAFRYDPETETCLLRDPQGQVVRVRARSLIKMVDTGKGRTYWFELKPNWSIVPDEQVSA